VTGKFVARVKLQKARAMRKAPTAGEAVLWEALRAGALGGLRFRRQQPMYGFIVDFYCSTHELVVEVDGGVHARQTAGDLERDEILTAAGLTVLRFSNEDVLERLPRVIAQILGLPGRLPPPLQGEGGGGER